jgi:TonB-linked SusC/RagA family outer membrane protein
MKMKIVLICTMFLLCLIGQAGAQSLQVSGRALSRTGSPLSGVTVTVKGTSTSTLTDAQGNFTITVPRAGSVLQLSHVSLEPQEITVSNAGPVQVSLTDRVANMDEVVVIGYGTQRKSVVTGAISSVKAGDLENMPIYRIEQSLQGRASGLTIAASSGQPGSSSTVRVRGTTSINGAAANPLYVVDGVIIDNGGIDFLNQNDIESIEVLKDAASSAIYGTRGAAGVILVTTKKGRVGSMRVNYNGYYGVQSPARKLDLLDASEYATLRNEASVASGGAILFNNPQSYGKGTDWQDLIFNKSARIQDHQVSFSGGSDRSTYFASFGLFDQEGIVATDISQYTRFNVRLNSSHKINKWLSFGNNVGYSHIKAKGLGNTNSEFGGPLSSAINLDPITPAVVTDPAMLGQAPYNVPGRPFVTDANGNPYGISTIVGQEMTNPLAYIQTRLGNYSWSDNIVGNIYAEIEPVKGLRLRSTLGTKLAYWGGEYFTPIAYYNASTSNSVTSFYRDNNRGLNWSWENTASYNRRFGDHDFTLLLGTGAYVDDNARGTNATYRNLPATNFDEASMNYSLPAADRIAGGYESITHKLSSIFGRLTYNYQEKYLFTGLVRRDGSSRFGTNNKFGYFPSVALGWVASRENFWPLDDVSFFKIRGSYGVNGTDELGNFAYVSTIGGGRNYTFGNDNYVIGNSPNAPANPDLKWEETTQSNIGFDATLFRNFTLTFDVFSKKTTGMLQPIIIPGYVGAGGSPTGNVASMENRGFEVELGYNRRIGAANVSLKGNLSHIQNEVTDLGTVAFRTGAGFQASDYEIGRLQVGHPIGAFYGFDVLGIFQNQQEIDNYTSKTGQRIQPNAAPGDFKWADINGDGIINGDDRTFIGDPTPTWSYGFTVNADFKGFDFVVFGQGVAGNDIFNGLRRLDIPSANWTRTALGRWTGEGTSNTFPRLVNGDPNKNFSRPSSFYLSDGSYFRLKTVQLGYTVNNALVNRIGLQRLRVYVGSNNLFTFTKYTGYDPEIGGGSYGIDRGVYPQARAFMAGINVGL